MAKAKREKRGRRVIGVHEAAYHRLAALKSELEAMSGRPVSLGDALERAVESLEAAHAGQAWLSPAEQAEPLRQRVREAVVGNLVLLRAQCPQLGIGAIKYDAPHDLLLVEVDGSDAPIGLCPDSPKAGWQPTLPH